MTTQTHGELIPDWTPGDRLRKARTLMGLSVEEFSELALVSKKTINNYEADRVTPRPLALARWAQVTGVSLEWLKTGETPADGGGGDDGPRVISQGGSVTERKPFADISPLHGPVDEPADQLADDELPLAS